MKTRAGFVSNSSSSSFVLVVKNHKEGDSEEDLRIKLRNALGGVAKDFCFGEREFYNGILDAIDEVETVSFSWYGMEVPLSDIAKDGVKIYHGSHCDNEGREVDAALCSTPLTVDTDEIKIIWEPRS